MPLMNGNKAIDRQLQIQNAADSTVRSEQLSAIELSLLTAGNRTLWLDGVQPPRQAEVLIGSLSNL